MFPNWNLPRTRIRRRDKMQSDRRRFLAASATGLFGFEQFLELAMAQTGTDAPKFAPGVVDFWADAMGISPDSLLGGAATRGRKTSQGPSATAIDYAREPLFLQYDADEKTLITSDQIPNARLMPSGDTQVQLQLSRMRLNPDDTKMFHSYTSGGIYVDMQQHPFTQPQGFFGTLQSLATSAFSAIQPPAAGGGRGGKAGGKSAAAKGPPSASGKTAMVAAAPSSSGAQAIPLQNASQAQSLALPAGKGKTAFLAFVKDRKLSAFGTFLSAFEQLAGAGAAFIPLLNLPVVGTATLGAVRGLVANLQAHGGDQAWLMQSPPLDVVATADSISQAPEALRLRTGSYIVIPKSHADALKPYMNKVKILDGFLVPQEATMMDAFDAHQTTAPEVSYISVIVGVKAGKAVPAAG